MRAPIALLALVASTSTSAATLTASDAKLLNSLLATAVSKDPRVDLLTSTDVKKALDVEAARSFAGCDAENGSCMAEIAAAMDASQVLHGTLGVLGDDVVMSLTLFDSATASAVGRVTAVGDDAGAVAGQIDVKVKELLLQLPAGGRTRVLLLDFDNAHAASTSSVGAGGPPLLLLVGGGVGVAGALALGGAGVVEALAAGAAEDVNGTKPNDQRLAAQNNLRGYTVAGPILWIGGGVLVIGGVVLAAVPLLGE